MSRILIIDPIDTTENLIKLEDYLIGLGYDARIRQSQVSGNFSVLYDNVNYDVCLIDLGEPNDEFNGMEIIRTIHTEEIDTTVIILTAYGTYEQAVDAINLGVFYWFDKGSLDLDLFKNVIEDACRVVPLRLQRKWLKATIGAR